MENAKTWTVIDYCTEEVSRQGHDVTTLDGIERVGWMLNAWAYALDLKHHPKPSLQDALYLGMLVEPGKNASGWRTCEVRVGPRFCPPFELVPHLLKDAFEDVATMAPLAFYKRFELIHPFVDGNGRTGKILLNWLNGTLLDPIFPPDDFWGPVIRNP